MRSKASNGLTVMAPFQVLQWDGNARECSTQNPDIYLYTGVSDSFDCSAFWGNQWLQLQWPERLEEWSIAHKNLLGHH